MRYRQPKSRYTIESIDRMPEFRRDHRLHSALVAGVVCGMFLVVFMAATKLLNLY